MATFSQQVSGSTTAVLLSPAPSDNYAGSTVLVYNNGTATVCVGPSGVSTSTGFRLAAGASVSLDLNPGESLYGIGAAAWSADVLASGV